ncbi:hypothetical protein [Paenibacillus whitsoniae]|uniref:Uncharacterized protein n=1 Tax=Paenibacillus whitsoniae TaxID=2496558 RepID=A0A3S0I7J5_9BACL|nr:hypothetical protein [Paenibacillus whitsoniae]RTE05012.1 hypothetical protein EJQ19_25720 [Paenibacillus whitsoniae]
MKKIKQWLVGILTFILILSGATYAAQQKAHAATLSTYALPSIYSASTVYAGHEFASESDGCESVSDGFCGDGGLLKPNSAFLLCDQAQWEGFLCVLGQIYPIWGMVRKYHRAVFLYV